MKKRILQTALAMVVAVAFVVMLEGINCKAIEPGYSYRGWVGFKFNSSQKVVPPSGSSIEAEKAALEKKIEQSDSQYSRNEAMLQQTKARDKVKTYVTKRTYLSDVLSTFRETWMYTNAVFGTAPTPATSTSQPTIPTPGVTPTPTPTPTIPDPVTPVQYNTPTSYYFVSSGDQWQEVWYNTSSLMYLRGSVPADCDTSRTDCWQLSFDLDGETVTVQGNGCMDWRGTSLDVSFNFDDDLINEVESYFIKGGDNVPLTFRYYAGNTLKKASVSGQPKLMLTYDGWLKLYVAK